MQRILFISGIFNPPCQFPLPAPCSVANAQVVALIRFYIAIKPRVLCIQIRVGTRYLPVFVEQPLSFKLDTLNPGLTRVLGQLRSR